MFKNLLYKIRTSKFDFGISEAKGYYGLANYIDENTHFTDLKLNYFCFLFQFIVLFPIVLLILNVLVKGILLGRKQTQTAPGTSWAINRLQTNVDRLSRLRQTRYIVSEIVFLRTFVILGPKFLIFPLFQPFE